MPKRNPMFAGFDAKTTRVLGLGLELGMLIGGMTWLGHYLDGRWGTSPWLALSGALLATIGGSYGIYQTMMGKDRSKRNAHATQKAPMPMSVKKNRNVPLPPGGEEDTHD